MDKFVEKIDPKNELFSECLILQNSGIDKKLIERGIRQAILRAAFKEVEFIDETLEGLDENYGHLEQYEPLVTN